MRVNDRNYMRQNTPGLLSCLIVVIMFISGCATTSMFSPYPRQISVVKENIERSSFDKSLEQLEKGRGSRDETLYMLERARVAQLKGDFATSISDFRTAIQNEAKVEEQAKISFSQTAAKGSAMLTNDNAIPYKASAYERILMHHYQAMNYMAQKNWDAVGVEVRRAALEQKDALERHHKELAEAEESARKEKYNPRSTQNQVDQQYRTMYAAAGNVKNSFQNAYTFYFSGVVWEILNEDNDAYIDYKKALEIFPENRYLQDDVLRLAKQLGFREEYDLFRKKFAREAVEVGDGFGEIVVIYEEGFVPVKEDTVFHLAIPMGVHSVSFPYYRDVGRKAGNLRLSSDARMLGTTDMILDVRALAIKDLQEKMPGIMIRQVLRLLAKDRLQQTAKDQLGDAGRLIAMLYNVISEQADRRSWLTLPRNVQVFRSRLPVGVQELAVVSSQNNQRASVPVNIRQNTIAILHVVGTRSQLLVKLL